MALRLTQSFALRSAVILSVALSACAPSSQPSPLSPPVAGNQPTASISDDRRSTPIVAGRPARVYVMAGFKDDCTPVTPAIKVTAQPAKGIVTLKPNQFTVLRRTASGNCDGKRVSGTGIYYTAREGTNGADQFTIEATANSEKTVTKTFRITIAD